MLQTANNVMVLMYSRKAIGKMDDNASDQDYPDPDDTAASEDLPKSAASSLLSNKAKLAAIAATVGSLYLL
jgi:hypothetical protein